MQIENAIDLHCHFGPDTLGGPLEAAIVHGVSALEVAREARQSGQAALVLKSHSFASPALAAIVSEANPGLRVFGGICTDFPSGGLNVSAVEAALAMGAKVVWLPTVHSQQDVSHRNLTNVKGPGLRVTDDTGELVPAVREIFDLVVQKDAILATGHTSADEHYAVAKKLGRQGKVLVTHAGERSSGPRLSPAQCAELADMGATIELTALTCQDVFGVSGKSPTEMSAMIEAIGPNHCTLATDYGWARRIPRPASGLRDFVESLWDHGVAERDLQIMVSKNPARLLGLDV